MHSIGALIYLEVELENALEETVGTGKGIWWYWATSGNGTGKSVSITMVATVYRCTMTNGVHLEVELENHLNALEETSVIQLKLEKEFGGTGPHLEVELEKVFQLLWSLL